MSAEVDQMPVTKHGVHTLCFRSLKRTHDTFISDHGCMPEPGTFQNDQLANIQIDTVTQQACR